MNRHRANLLLLVCAAVWGTAFLFQKSAMASIEPMLFVAARGGIAALVLVPLVLLENRHTAAGLPSRFWTMSALAGAAFAVAAVLQQQGIVTATVTNAGFLTSLYVVATPLIAWALMHRRPRPVFWLAIGLSVLGAWLLGGGGSVAIGGGDMLVVASAAFWALHVVLIGMAAPLGRPILLTAGQFLVVAALAFAGALAFETVSWRAIADAAVDIAFVGILSSAVTFTLFTYALRHASPAEAAIIISTEMVFAAATGYLVLGERLTATGLAGAVLILAAVLIVQLAPDRQAPAAAAERSS